jgi:hypothetical protein
MAQEGFSHFKSRTGRVAAGRHDIYIFVTDLRNIERFVPAEMAENLKTEADSGSFSVPMVGTVSVRITDREPVSRVVYGGDALKKSDFELSLLMNDEPDNTTSVTVTLDADLNPMLRMVAAQPIAKFLESLVSEMENFRDWKDVIK